MRATAFPIPRTKPNGNVTIRYEDLVGDFDSVKATLESRLGNPIRLRSAVPIIVDGEGGAQAIAPVQGIVEIETTAGASYRLSPERR